MSSHKNQAPDRMTPIGASKSKDNLKKEPYYALVVKNSCKSAKG